MSETDTANPALVEIIRGSLVESRHAGAIAVADADGRLLLAFGDVDRPVFPRSAVKAMQAICWSGPGQPMRSGSAMTICGRLRLASGNPACRGGGSLPEAGLDKSYLACGAHWPVSEATCAS
jgi:L-asparaginase II